MDIKKLFYSPLKASEVLTTASSPEDSGYAPLPLRHLTAGAEVPFNLYLKVKNAADSKPRILLFCAAGNKVDNVYYVKLVQLQIVNLYFASIDIDKVIAYLEQRKDHFLNSDEHSSVEKAVLVYDLMQNWTKNFFTSDKSRLGSQLKLSLKSIDDLLGLIKQEAKPNEFVFSIRKYHTDLYNHSLNVCMMGLAFVNYLNWSPFKVKDFGLGALLHDIGMTEIPQYLMNKETPLTPAERQQIERHPNASIRILKGLNCLGMQSMLMVQQHHENGDGSGYPQGLKSADLSPWAQILRIIDSYEAVTSPRPWRPAVAPLAALVRMCGDWRQSNIYDQGYLDSFVRFITKK